VNENLTEVVLVLDRSGSMFSCRSGCIEALNDFVTKQKKLPGECRLTLVQFDGEYEVVFAGKDIKDVGPIDFVPRGSTCLDGALGRTIDEVGMRLSNTAEYDRPGGVVVVVITDGMENASHDHDWSRKYRPTQYNNSSIVHELRKHQEEKYGWRFVYLGANVDAAKEAGRYGIAPSSAMAFSSSNAGVKRATEALNTNISGYRGSSVVQKQNMVMLSSSDRDVRDITDRAIKQSGGFVPPNINPVVTPSGLILSQALVQPMVVEPTPTPEAKKTLNNTKRWTKRDTKGKFAKAT
jgi:hypothetical protein